MKKNSFIKGLAMALTCALAITAFTPAVSPVTAEAANKKVTAKTNYKKAPAVKRNHTYTVNCKSGNGSFVKFTAPSTGKYQFTIYDIKSTYDKNSTDLANIYIRYTDKYNYLSRKTVKTQGGKTDWLCMATKTSYNKFYKNRKVKISTYLYKRTATVSMKKGQTYYIEMSYFTGKKSKCTYKLQIKKK